MCGGGAAGARVAGAGTDGKGRPGLGTSETTLEEFKARLPLADVVGRYVKLARKGRELQGLCPFHKEKTPSFAVVEDKGFFHCFGCGAHGNAIDFVMVIERLEFREALDRLADITGLPAPAPRGGAGGAAPRADPSLFDALAAAALWFERQLREPGGASARAYLERRGVRADAVEGFRLGWAPGGRAALKAALLGQGLAEGLLVEAGLLIRPEDGARGTYDRFRERVTFPIADARGRVVGFGARALGDAKPKYLNSPETPLFSKGRLLYNHHRAQPAARESRAVVVAEGYLDVIAFARAGVAHAVAPLGTAMTEDQLRALWRMADEPVVCMDGDAAGIRAAGRAAERALPLLEPGKSLGFALLPSGQDPDSLLAHGGPEPLRATLREPVPLVDLLWRRETAAGPPETPERRAALEGRLRALVRQIAHPDVRAHYAAAIETRLDAAGLGRRRPRRGRPGPGRDRAQSPPAAPTLEARAAQPSRERARRLLRIVLLRPQILRDREEDVAAVGETDPTFAEICAEILTWYTKASGLDGGSLTDHLAQYGFGPLVDHILAHRPWVRGVLAERVDGFPPAKSEELGKRREAAPDGAGGFEDDGDGRFGDLYRILREPRGGGDDGAGGGRGAP